MMDIDDDFDAEDEDYCSDVETYFTKIATNQLSPIRQPTRQPTSQSQRQGEGAWDLNWPIRETQLTRANIADPPASPPVQQQQFDYEHDNDVDGLPHGIQHVDSFREIYLAGPVVEPDFFNSFEDDFDDFDI